MKRILYAPASLLAAMLAMSCAHAEHQTSCAERPRRVLAREDAADVVKAATSSENAVESVDNQVADCVQLALRDVVGAGTVALARAQLTSRKSLADCGCKSALLGYWVVETVGDAPDLIELERVSGRVGLKSGEERLVSFVLSTDSAIAYSGPLALRIGCAPAD